MLRGPASEVERATYTSLAVPTPFCVDVWARQQQSTGSSTTPGLSTRRWLFPHAIPTRTPRERDSRDPTSATTTTSTRRLPNYENEVKTHSLMLASDRTVAHEQGQRAKFSKQCHYMGNVEMKPFRSRSRTDVPARRLGEDVDVSNIKRIDF